MYFLCKKNMHSISLTQLLLLLLYLQIILSCLWYFQSLRDYPLLWVSWLNFQNLDLQEILTIDSPLSSNTSLIHGSIRNIFFFHQSGTFSWRDTHRRQNQLVCSDPIIILTDKGHTADLFQVVHISQNFTWTLLKTFIHL